jgi:AcrR family transcriptional regulator
LNHPNRTKRIYNSTRRKEQARLTRRQILSAAHEAFIAHGYAGATIDSIARAAGVAPETIYATFGTKRAILSSLFGVSLVGDDDPTPLLQRQHPQEVMHLKDQHLQIRLFAEDMAEIMGRVAPLFEVLHSAAKTETEMAGMLDQMLNERAQAMRVFVGAVASNGPLQAGLDVETASETVFALSSAEMYNLLVGQRGWSAKKYASWLTSALDRLLIP